MENRTRFNQAVYETTGELYEAQSQERKEFQIAVQTQAKEQLAFKNSWFSTKNKMKNSKVKLSD